MITKAPGGRWEGYTYYGFTKAGKPAKKPFAYSSTATGDWLNMLYACGFDIDEMILLSTYDTEAREILEYYRDHGWGDKVQFLEVWKESESYMDPVYGFQTRVKSRHLRVADVPPHVQEQLRKDLEAWKRQRSFLRPIEVAS